MTLLQEVVERELVRGDVRWTPYDDLLLWTGGIVIGVHVVRALLVSDSSATLWLTRRGFTPDARSTIEVREYLRRLRWSRVASTALLVGACAVALAVGRFWVSFLSLPFLGSVLLAEVLAPGPRRGRVRVAQLQHRSRDYFAPTPQTTGVRLLAAAAVGLSIVGADYYGAASRLLVAHAVVVAIGALAFEAALRQTARRALPDRQPDLALDTALRVASARQATAAALLFTCFGLFMPASSLLGELDPGPLSWSCGFALQATGYAAVGVAIHLLQPLRSWRPRAAT